MAEKFYSNGKLLLTGEYAVLDGALSLAIPTKYGQLLSIQKIGDSLLTWNSLDENGNSWFSATFMMTKDAETKQTILNIATEKNSTESDMQTAKTLLRILSEAIKMNPTFLSDTNGYQIDTKLTFPRNWGLGSSSTLINNIASWAKVDAFKLLWNAFSGSGYDIACAQHNYPITYQVKDKKPTVQKIDFNPSFKDKLYFVYLNQKQNSREGIAQYKNSNANKSKFILKISELTLQISKSKNITEFNRLISIHEQTISDFLQIPTVKDNLFPDFPGGLKSLGAWGGDFILATGSPRDIRYFKRKGYETVIQYKDMAL